MRFVSKFILPALCVAVATASVHEEEEIATVQSNGVRTLVSETESDVTHSHYYDGPSDASRIQTGEENTRFLYEYTPLPTPNFILSSSSQMVLAPWKT
jgi:hypothetical protein